MRLQATRRLRRAPRTRTRQHSTRPDAHGPRSGTASTSNAPRSRPNWRTCACSWPPHTPPHTRYAAARTPGSRGHVSARTSRCAGCGRGHLPALLEAARRLAAMEQEEMPAMRARAEMTAGTGGRPPRRADGGCPRPRSPLRAGRMTRRVTELESSLADAWAQKRALEDEIRAVHATPAVPGAQPDHVQISDEHGRILQDIAHVGFMRTSPDGRTLEANTHAARLCGYSSPELLIEASILPEPLRLLADADPSSAARFEVCLQLADGRPPRWVAGTQLPLGMTTRT